jgi:ankyrin repeat protein
LEKDIYDTVTIASVINDVDMLNLLLKSSSRAKLITSPYEGTALIASTHLGHVAVVRELIKTGAPMDHINNLRWTALIEAIVLGDGGPNHVACVRLLIDAGADVNIVDGEGTKPLGLAKQRSFGEMVTLLKTAGGKL